MLPLNPFGNFIGSYPTLDATFTFKKNANDEIVIAITNHQKNSVKEARLDKTAFKYIPLQCISEIEKVQWLLKNYHFEVTCHKDAFRKREAAFSLLTPDRLEWKLTHESIVLGDTVTALSNRSLISYGVNLDGADDALLLDVKTMSSIEISSKHGHYVSCVEVSPDFFAIVCLKGPIEIRDRENGKLQKYLPERPWWPLTCKTRSLQLLSNGLLCERTVYSHFEKDYKMTLWNWETGEVVQMWTEYKGCLELSNKSLLLFSDTSLDVFKMKSEEYLKTYKCEVDVDNSSITDVFELKDETILVILENGSSRHKSCKIFNPTTKILTELKGIAPLTALFPFSEGFIGIEVGAKNNKIICNLQALKQKVLDSGDAGSMGTISAFCPLIDGTIALGCRSGTFFILNIEGKCFYVENFGKEIISISDLKDGSLAIKTRAKIFILSPKKKENAIALKIAKLELKIKYSPDNLSLYQILAKEYQEKNLTAKEYKLYFQGLSIATRAHNLYKARRFFEKATALSPEKREPYFIYLNYLDNKTDLIEKRITLIKFYKHLNQELEALLSDMEENLRGPQESNEWVKIGAQYLNVSEEKNQCLQAIKKLATGLYKTRLEVGGGNFTFAKDLIDVHRETHPGLGAFIIATELSKPEGKEIEERIAKLKQEEGVSIYYNIDAQKIHQHFRDKRIQRIHWNCPNGGGSPEMKKLFKETFSNFFQSASRVQKPKDRIHVTLLQEPANWKKRQIDCNLVKAATEAKYCLIRKRRFQERYPGYKHKKTDKNQSIKSKKREFVFEKLSRTYSSNGETEDLLTQAQGLCNSKIKEYQVKSQKKDEVYFECSTDGDSSDYYDDP